MNWTSDDATLWFLKSGYFWLILGAIVYWKGNVYWLFSDMDVLGRTGCNVRHFVCHISGVWGSDDGARKSGISQKLKNVFVNLNSVTMSVLERSGIIYKGRKWVTSLLQSPWCFQGFIFKTSYNLNQNSLCPVGLTDGFVDQIVVRPEAVAI